MDLNRKIKELQEEIDVIKDIQHNNGMHGVAKTLNEKLIENATKAEFLINAYKSIGIKI